MSEEQQQQEQVRGTRKSMRGIVVSDKGDKSITVMVERSKRHTLYHKTVRIRSKFYVHDEQNEARIGDKVEIMGTRPLSRTKRWRMVRVLEKAPQD